MIYGLLLWREFKGAGERPRLLSIVTLILLAAGIALLAISRGGNEKWSPRPAHGMRLTW